MESKGNWVRYKDSPAINISKVNVFGVNIEEGDLNIYLYESNGNKSRIKLDSIEERDHVFKWLLNHVNPIQVPEFPDNSLDG